MKYKVYSDENSPPGWGVQAIVFEHEDTGWSIAAMNDYYILRDDRFIAVDFVGMLDYVVNELKLVWVGRMLDRKEFERIFHQAIADMDFAQKVGYLPTEYKLESIDPREYYRGRVSDDNS